MNSHGEVMVYKTNAIPKGAKKVKTSGAYQIIAPSEISGNHHVIDLHDEIEFFELDGKLYFETKKETKLKCLLPDRHHERKIGAGIYEVDFHQEFNYLTGEAQKLAD